MCLTRSSPCSRIQRGSTRFASLILLGLLALGAVLTAVVWKRGEADRIALPPGVTASVPQAAAATAEGTTETLRRAAREAVAARQLLAPAGQSAFERYLVVLHEQPGDPVAVDALRELFPFAAEQAASVVRSGDPDEAQREIDLLARADPGNYTLTLLRQQLAARQRAPTASTPPPTPMAAPSMVATLPVPAQALPVASPPRTPAAVVGNRPPAANAPLATAALMATTPPVLLHRVEPYYPQAARHARREGWVELEFTVGTDGRVADVHVLGAAPGRVFELAAITAVQRWVFTPAMEAGHAVTASLHQRLDFRL